MRGTLASRAKTTIAGAGHVCAVMLVMALFSPVGARAQNPSSVNNTPRTFQAVAGNQTVFVLKADQALYKNAAPGGPVQRVDRNVWTFQALDADNVFVLGTDGSLWLEQAPFGQNAPKRQIVDAAVTRFQALGTDKVLVLDAKGDLWLEYAPFGLAVPPKRDMVDGMLSGFQALDSGHFLVLRNNNELWLQTGVGSNPRRQKIEQNVSNFQGIDTQTVLVLRADGSLWRENGLFGTVPPARMQVDANIQAFQSVPGSDTICVLASDASLWLDQPPFGNVPPVRQAVDSRVMGFQVLDGGDIYALRSNSQLWVEQAPFSQEFSRLIAAQVPQAPLAYSPVPTSFFAVAPWDPKNNFPPLRFGAIGHATFAWGDVQPASNADAKFESLNAAVAKAVAAGMLDHTTNTVNMAITLGLTPQWALTDDRGNCIPAGDQGADQQCAAAPDHIADWQTFLELLINHFNGQDFPHIRYYELWNEANDSGWWAGKANKGEYSDCQDTEFCPMLKLAAAAYPIIHQDPYSMLLTPSVTGPVGTLKSNSGVSWMTAYLSSGGAQYADGGAFHGYIAISDNKDPISPTVNPYPMPEQDATPGCTPFDNCYGSIITKATQMQLVFNRYLPGAPVFQTEGSWGEGNILDFPTQVDWLSRYYLLQAGLRSTLNLQMSSWFAYGGPPGKPWGMIECPGFLPSASECPGTGPTPAGEAYSQVETWIAGAAVPNACSQSPEGIWTCAMSRPLGYTAKAVWYTGTQKTVQYNPGEGYSQYRCLSDSNCLSGAVLPLTMPTIPVGSTPILFESPARVCLLYDPAKLEAAGDTIAISLYPCDAAGTDLGSTAINLKATGIAPTSSFAVGGSFQFDPSLGPSGGYIYNLNTQGLVPGYYELQLSSSTGDTMLDSITYTAPFQVH